MNLVNFEEFKELREIKKYEDSYLRYLQSLGNSQLETEVHALLEEFSDGAYGKDYFTKGKLILNEISNRAHESVKIQIDELTRDTLSKL